jgi:hypothetical protein
MLLRAALIGEDCMDLFRTAVVDITMQLATCRALKSLPSEGEAVLQRKPRNQLPCQHHMKSKSWRLHATGLAATAPT